MKKCTNVNCSIIESCNMFNKQPENCPEYQTDEYIIDPAIAEEFQQKAEEAMNVRGYRLRNNDIFEVSAETFFNNSLLWTSSYQIMSSYIKEIPRRLFKIELPFFKKKITMVQIMFIGEQL